MEYARLRPMPDTRHADRTARALGVDPDIKDRNLKRLRRIEGQVRGLYKMVDEALRAVGRELARNHLKHCAASAIRAGESEANAMYDELIDMMYRTSR